MVGDFDGDGNGDIISFGHEDIIVGLSDGTSSFSSSSWLEGVAFVHSEGWNYDAREIGYVSEADYGNGFTHVNNYLQHLHEIRIADANGDGMDDIIGFFDDGVYVSYSTGQYFKCPDMVSSFSNNIGYLFFYALNLVRLSFQIIVVKYNLSLTLSTTT